MPDKEFRITLARQDLSRNPDRKMSYPEFPNLRNRCSRVMEAPHNFHHKRMLASQQQVRIAEHSMNGGTQGQVTQVTMKLSYVRIKL